MSFYPVIKQKKNMIMLQIKYNACGIVHYALNQAL